MPFPFMGGWGGGPPPQGGKEPPARVAVALDFLCQLTVKTMKRAAANDVSIEVIDGQPLTTAEANAHASACHMLNDYFLGKLEKNAWESEGDKAAPGVAQGPGTLCNCFVCYPEVKPGCPLCKGSGQVLVFPLGAD